MNGATRPKEAGDGANRPVRDRHAHGGRERRRREDARGQGGGREVPRGVRQSPGGARGAEDRDREARGEGGVVSEMIALYGVPIQRAIADGDLEKMRELAKQAEEHLQEYGNV